MSSLYDHRLFAEDGSVATIANTGTSEVSMSSGFSNQYIQNKSVPLRKMNYLGKAASYSRYYLSCGGLVTFDQSISNAIGGYPRGVQLGYWDGTHYRRVISLIDDNTFNFVTTPSYIDNKHWSYCDRTIFFNSCVQPTYIEPNKSAGYGYNYGSSYANSYTIPDGYSVVRFNGQYACNLIGMNVSVNGVQHTINEDDKILLFTVTSSGFSAYYKNFKSTNQSDLVLTTTFTPKTEGVEEIAMMVVSPIYYFSFVGTSSDGGKFISFIRPHLLTPRPICRMDW